MQAATGTIDENEAGHMKPMNRTVPRRCKYVDEDNGYQNQDQGSVMGMTYNSNSVRPKPLALSPGPSSISSSRGRTPQRTPSSPESTAQRSPLQAGSSASLIFERSVQEDILIPQTSPSIPSHIRTEDHIPPVLEASSVAITDDLDPDSVEIVTHNTHYPVSNEANPELPLQPPSPDPAAVGIEDVEELPLANYNSEVNDIRRLSFISFADVVNSENAEIWEYLPSGDFLQRGAGSPNASATANGNMSPSPLHSPTSSHGFGTSPPTSISASFKGLELSPNRVARETGSPSLAAHRPVSPSLSGDLSVETMGQALRRTGSGDLGAARNQSLYMTDHND